MSPLFCVIKQIYIKKTIILNKKIVNFIHILIIKIKINIQM